MEQKLKKLLRSKLARDIIRFFHQNQGSIDTVSGVSAWVNKDKKEVKKVLDRLVKEGILEEHSEAGTKGYCYTRDKKVMDRIEKSTKAGQ
jgi:predicted transcriptional regulator